MSMKYLTGCGLALAFLSFVFFLAWIVPKTAPGVKQPDLILGVARYYDHGDLATAEIAAKFENMAECRERAAKALQQPHDPAAVKLACAALEIQ